MKNVDFLLMMRDEGFSVIFGKMNSQPKEVFGLAPYTAVQLLVGV